MSEPSLELHTVAIRDDGAFSVLLWEKRPFAVSVERTFEDAERPGHGKRLVIPAGILVCKRTIYQKGGYPTYEILVSGHSRVLFHKGNKETDSEACVIVAESFGSLDGKTAVMDSKGGFEELMALSGGREVFTMLVTGR